MGQPVKFELTEATRQAVDEYLKATGKRAGRYQPLKKASSVGLKRSPH
jgi:hypothetical protein